MQKRAHTALWITLAVIVGGGTAFLFLYGTEKAFTAIQNHGVAVEEVLTRTLAIKDPNTPGEPWGTTKGFTMFRGNPTRTWYGSGSLPFNPEITWKYPKEPMCDFSTVGAETKQWCGTGWTGQPAVWVRPDGITEIIFGAYDKKIHFVNADTGEETRPSFMTGDIIKGSVTIDPDGFPLLYFGSRDNKLRILSLQDTTELWSLDADEVQGLWNNDWDGNPVIMNDTLFEGGENGWFFAIRLHRAYDQNGTVTVSPNIVFKMPSYTSELIANIGGNVSIENSVSIYKNTVYFANSGGRIMGLDITNIHEGIAPVVFDYWAGDDIDASIVIDQEGMLYVAIEEERYNQRSKDIGQLIKLDPRKSNPLVWNIHIPAKNKALGGIWSTPALYGSYLYVTTNPGELLVVNIKDGSITSAEALTPHLWSSPLISNNELLIATCQGEFRAYSLENPASPSLVWKKNIPSGSCIESTPLLWNEALYVGARDGFFYKMQ